MEDVTAIELLRNILPGEKKDALPPDSMQVTRAKQKKIPTPCPQQMQEQSLRESLAQLNCISDDGDKRTPSTIQRSKNTATIPGTRTGPLSCCNAG